MAFNKKQKLPPRRSFASDQSFKINRTIVGTTSSSIDEARTTAPNLESPRFKTHQLAFKRRKILHVFIVIILLTVFLWVMVFNFTSNVKIELVGIDKVSDDHNYQRVIDDYLKSHPASRLRFLLNQEDLMAYISQAAPEVKEASQSKDEGIGNTIFSLQMRSPVVGWVIDGKQYFVDSEGIAFEKNYYKDPRVNITDASGVLPDLQSGAIASNRLLSFAGRIVALSAERGYEVVEAVLPEGTTRQLSVKLKDTGDYFIKMSVDRPAGEQVEDMSRVVEYLKSRGLSPEYIDVRVSGKAFYR